MHSYDSFGPATSFQFPALSSLRATSKLFFFPFVLLPSSDTQKIETFNKEQISSTGAFFPRDMLFYPSLINFSFIFRSQ